MDQQWSLPQGRNYVDVNKFNNEKKYIYFQEYNHPTYSQRFDGFISNLSVIDLLFNCGPDSHEKLYPTILRKRIKKL